VIFSTCWAQMGWSVMKRKNMIAPKKVGAFMEYKIVIFWGFLKDLTFFSKGVLQKLRVLWRETLSNFIVIPGFIPGSP